MRVVIWAVVFAIASFAVGYAIFGHVHGNYVALLDIFSDTGDAGSVIRVNATTIRNIQRAIATTTVLGTLVGLIVGGIHELHAGRHPSAAR